MKTLKNRWTPEIISGFFYGIISIFSLVIGIICIAAQPEISGIELSEEAIQQLETSPVTMATAVGIITIITGILQGLAAYGILFSSKKGLAVYALIFTVLSVASSAGKLFVTFNALSIVKCAAYILILVVLIIRMRKKD